MKKVVFGIILSVSLAGVVYSQSPRSNQIGINGVLFTLGVNRYDNDYDLIFNKWYQKHTSAKDLKPGEPLDWVNNFTSKFNISTANYDVSLNQIDIGKDFHCIQFKGASYNDSSKYIYLFYDNNGTLVLVSIQSVWDYVKIFDGVKTSRPITFLDINKKIDIYATDLFQFFDNITYELKYNLVSTGMLAITEMNIGLVNSTIQADFKKIVLWTADYQKKTGLSLNSKNNNEKLIGFEFEDSSKR
jgi:hypothetical protein